VGSQNWTRNNKNEAGVLIVNKEVGQHSIDFILKDDLRTKT
jgi:hypothetical protein